jgi:hypothetical protein
MRINTQYSSTERYAAGIPSLPSHGRGRWFEPSIAHSLIISVCRSFSAFGLSRSVREISCELRWYPAAPHNLGWGITMNHRQNLLIPGRTKT